jgi:hypothetical protein
MALNDVYVEVAAVGIQGLGAGTGATGVIGASGATGLDGASGAIGNDGASGAIGYTGSTGIQGASGLIGLTGATGIGERGATGPGGGDAGATGIQGASGINGSSGIAGATGEQGASGIGLTGATGATGIGETGASGINGATGVQGASGIGETGASGADSTVPGATGEQGASGVDGATGVGLTGATGVAGASGAGVTPTITFTTSTTDQVIVETIDAALYRSVKYEMQVTSGTSYQASELRLLIDEPNIFLTEYGMIGDSLGMFSAYYSPLNSDYSSPDINNGGMSIWTSHALTIYTSNNNVIQGLLSITPGTTMTLNGSITVTTATAFVETDAGIYEVQTVENRSPLLLISRIVWTGTGDIELRFTPDYAVNTLKYIKTTIAV